MSLALKSGEQMIDWLNDNAGAIQAISTVVLVVITAIYALRTHNMASSAKSQADATKAMADDLQEQRRDADRPYLLIEALDLGSTQWIEVNQGERPDPHAAYPKSLSCRVFNTGRGPAKEVVITVMNDMSLFERNRKDFLGPSEFHQAVLNADRLATAIRGNSQGFESWASENGITLSSESSYDCAILAFCTDIYDRPWATYLRLGMMSTTDNVRNVVTRRQLETFEHRVVAMKGNVSHDS